MSGFATRRRRASREGGGRLRDPGDQGGQLRVGAADERLDTLLAPAVKREWVGLLRRLMDGERESLTHKLLTENQKLSCSKHLVSQVSQRPESKTEEKAGKRHAHFSPHT